MQRIVPVMVLALAAALAGCGPGAGLEVFATGLNQPRGMSFAANGDLLVAQAGAIDPRADAMVSPPTNHSGSLVRIDAGRQIATVLDRLPFTHYAAAGDVGAADVSVVGDTIYVLTAEGYDDSLSRSVLRVAPGGAPARAADLLAFAFRATPLAEQLAAGAVPSNPFAMLAAPDGNSLYVSDGASGSILRVGLDGAVRTVAVVPGVPPLTGLPWGPNGRLHVAVLSTLPLRSGGGAIMATGADGSLATVASGLTMPIDVVFDNRGGMYVLEFSATEPDRMYVANSGRLLYRAPGGTLEVLLDELNYPTSMQLAPNGDLFIAVNGAFSAAGEGAIMRLRR